jgi:hypothetical protein
MAFIIGLGGSGVRFVQTLIEQENPIFDGALTFDSTSVAEAKTIRTELSSKWKHVCLASEKSTLESVINAGVDVSFQSDNSQLALKQLASWRPSKEFINIPLGYGAGGIRAVGRSISIASTHVLQTELAQIQKDDICLIASTDGSTGSTLLIDVLEILNHTAPKARLTIVVLNSIVAKGISDINFCCNSVATLCELESYFSHYFAKTAQRANLFDREFPGARNLLVVNRQDGDQIQFAIEELPERINMNIGRAKFLDEKLPQMIQTFMDFVKLKPSKQKTQNWEIRNLESAIRNDLEKFYRNQKYQFDAEINGALQIGANRFIDRIQLILNDRPRFYSIWAYCRSRILTEFVDPEIVTKSIRGWLIALCLNRLQIDNNQVRITDENGDTHEFFILRPINPDGIDALPSVIESAPIALRSDPRSTAYGFSATKTLLHYGEIDARSFFGEKLEISTPATSVFHTEIRNFVGLGAPLKSTPQTENLSPTEIARNNLLAQREFSLRLIQMSYNGDEAVDRDGRIDPPETFFRDIVEEYFTEIESMLSPPATPLYGLPKKPAVPNRPKTKVQKKTATSTRKWRPLSGRLAATNAKPFGWIRYGIPVLLGIFSAAIATYFAIFSNSDEQQTWGNSATIVSGFMAGAAVCLGAVALIFSIQNSSVRIQRADRLYEACLGVQEAITLFELGREAALATNDLPSDSKSLWDDPSLHLAAMMLGSKLKIAMDTGLYRLLAYSDFENKVDVNTISSASALQAFSLIDGLVRIAPEIVYEKERPRSELISTPDQILETARKLNENLSQITYKMVSKSLEFTPSTNL